MKKELDRRLAVKNKATAGVRPDPATCQEPAKPKKSKAAAAKGKKDKEEHDTLEVDSSGKWRSTHQQLAESRILVSVLVLILI